jgi:hypothetical protein
MLFKLMPKQRCTGTGIPSRGSVSSRQGDLVAAVNVSPASATLRAHDRCISIAFNVRSRNTTTMTQITTTAIMHFANAGSVSDITARKTVASIITTAVALTRSVTARCCCQRVNAAPRHGAECRARCIVCDDREKHQLASKRKGVVGSPGKMMPTMPATTAMQPATISTMFRGRLGVSLR